MKPFSDKQDFHLTSDVGNTLERLNYRFETCFEPNRADLAGARVLELGSHTGRFTWAALQHLGATHVTGIEQDPAYIASAVRSLTALGVPPTRYRFIHGDVAQTVATLTPGDFDVILNTGFLYYLDDPKALLTSLHPLGARFMLFDGHHQSTRQILDRGHGYQDPAHLQVLLTQAGWRYKRINHPNGLSGYGRGTRITYRCHPT
jgi:protein-L-isoaspartate O-methyltransferase